MTVNVNWLKIDQNAVDLIANNKWTSDLQASADARLAADLLAVGVETVPASAAVRNMGSALGLYLLFRSVVGVRETTGSDDLYQSRANWYESEYQRMRMSLTYTAAVSV